eukprot:2939447-Rhodomonas_salina.3
MANPGPSHIAAAKCIVQYAKGTSTIGIAYTAGSAAANQLYAYVDADHAGDLEGCSSVTGYCVMMNGGAISWESKGQTRKVMELSSAESEFYAASACCCEIMYLRMVMSAMGFKQTGPTPVAEDNVACIYMLKSWAMFHKGKHINVHVYRLREFVHEGIMELYHVPSHEQAADCFSRFHRKAEENAARVPGAQVNTVKADEAYLFHAGAGKEETFYSKLKSRFVGRRDLELELEEMYVELKTCLIGQGDLGD